MLAGQAVQLAESRSRPPLHVEKGGETQLTRFLAGHAPIGAFRERFNLDGEVECLCGHPSESREHIVFDCPL